MRPIFSPGIQNLVLAAVMAATSSPQAPRQENSLGSLFLALDRPIVFDQGINKRPLEEILGRLRENINLEFIIDADAFEKKLNRKDIARSKVSFDSVSGMPASLFLDIFLRQLDAHFETRNGKVWIVPMTDQHNVYHPPCLRLEDDRRRRVAEAKLQHPVWLDKGLERMPFDDARCYLQDRFDLTILVDQRLFPKASKPVGEREIELPVIANVPLEHVLKLLLEQLKADMEIRGGALLIVPREAKKNPVASRE
jgi:hypothetical protein